MTPYRITIHCSDSKDGEFIPEETIKAWHLARGFRDIGYHFLVTPAGDILPGRPETEIGAHVEGENEGNLGICLEGASHFTERAFAGLRGLLDSLCLKYGIRPWQIHCHYQYPSAQRQGKTCPNIEINRLLAWYVGKLDEAIWPYILKESA
jgi:N-acetylmuramoyl-L-alanine amidase